MDVMTVYGLIESRDIHLVLRVLDHFAPKRQPMTDEFPFPQYAANPGSVYKDEESILRRLAGEANTPYSVYWEVSKRDNTFGATQVLLAYTSDDGVIVGIVVPEAKCELVLREFLQNDFIQWALVTGDEYPGESAEEFRRTCRSATLAKITNGKLVV